MDVVDVVIVLLLVGAAIHGLRLGALAQVLSFGGFLLGVTAGALVAGVVAPSLRTPTVKTVVVLLAVIGIAIVVGAVGRMLGTRTHRAARRWHLAGVDSLIGVGVGVAAALCALWVLANTLAGISYSGVGSAIQRSRIIRSVDDVMPPLPDLYSRVQLFLDDSGFPPVFSELEPPPSAVATPSSAWASTVAQPVSGSVVKVLGQACGFLQEGSGFVVAPGLVATNAHVVAGEGATQVVVSGQSYAATAVLYDPNFDLAVLRTSAPLGAPLALDPDTVASGTAAAVIGYPHDGPLTVGPAAVAGRLVAQGRNIYGQGTVSRAVYQLSARVQPGNSGGPLVAGNEQVIGVVFSRSTAYANVGYALTSPDVLSRVQAAEQRSAPVATGACTQG